MSARKVPLVALERAAKSGLSLTTSEASGLTGYSSDHLGLLRRRKVIEGTKRGRDWLLDAQSLYTYVKSEPKRGRRAKR